MWEKTIVLILITLALLIPITTTQASTSQGTPVVHVTGYTISPEVLTPNGIGTIKVTIINSGNLTASINKAYLFGSRFDTIAGDYKNIGSLAPQQEMDITFVFKAPSQEGVYAPGVRIDLSSGEDVRYPIPVKVSSSQELFVSDTSFNEIGIGEEKTLRIEIRSYGTIDAKKMEAELDPSDTSPIDPVGPSKILVGDVSGNTFSISYDVHVKAGTQENVYSIPLKLKWFSGVDGSLQESSLTIGAKVSGIKEPSLEVAKIVPRYIKPGSDFNITLSITNKGGSKASGINVNVSGASTPSKGPNNLYIDELLPKESQDLTFYFTSGESSSLGLYSIPIIVSYTGPSGVKTQAETVSIKGIAEMSIASISTDPTRINNGDFAILTIRIENIGNADGKSVRARVDLPFEGGTEAVIGKIEPGENAPAIFMFKTDSSGLYNYNITIEYADDIGTHEEKREAQLVVYSTDPSYGGVVALIILMAILLIYYRKKVKK